MQHSKPTKRKASPPIHDDDDGASKEFSDLDDYVKFAIFDYLDVRTVLNCSLVCKDWYRVAGEHKKTMEKLKLTLRSDWQELFSDIQTATGGFRSYKDMVISSERGIDNSLLQEISPLFSRIRNLELKRITFLDGNSLIKFLSYFESLKVLSIECIDFSAMKKAGETIVKFSGSTIEKLKYQKSDRSINNDRFRFNEEVVEVLRDSKIQFEQIEIGEIFLQFQYNNQSFTSIVDFLSEQKSLKKLNLSFPTLMSTIEFSSLYRYNKLFNLFLAPRWNGQNFFSIHKEHLRELEVGARKIPESFIKEIYENSKIEKLRLFYNNSEDNRMDRTQAIEEITFSTEQPNHHLKTLIIEHAMMQSTIDNLTKMFPDIECLELRNHGAKQFSTLNNCLTNLKTVRMSMDYWNKTNLEYYLTVLQNYPTLIKCIIFTIKEMNVLLESIIEIIDQNHLQLKKLCMASYDKKETIDFNIVSRFPNLLSVVTHQSHVERLSSIQLQSIRNKFMKEDDIYNEFSITDHSSVVLPVNFVMIEMS